MNILYVFPGQGSQYEGMGKDLCDAYPLANAAPPPPKPKGLFGALSKLGGDRMQIIAQTVTALKAVGVKDADLKPFAKAGLEWVEQQAGEVVARIRERVTGEA